MILLAPPDESETDPPDAALPIVVVPLPEVLIPVAPVMLVAAVIETLSRLALLPRFTLPFTVKFLGSVVFPSIVTVASVMAISVKAAPVLDEIVTPPVSRLMLRSLVVPSFHESAVALLLIVSAVLVDAPVVSRRMFAPLTVVLPVTLVTPITSMRSDAASPSLTLPFTLRFASVATLPCVASTVKNDEPAAPTRTLPLKPEAPLTSSASSTKTAPELSVPMSVMAPVLEMLRLFDANEKAPEVFTTTASASPLPTFTAPLRFVVPDTVRLLFAVTLPVTSTLEPRKVSNAPVLPIDVASVPATLMFVVPVTRN